MSNVPHLGGWRAESPDPEDRLIRDNMSRMLLKESSTNGVLDLRKWCSPIENQRDIGSCVGNGVVGGLEFLEIRDGIPYQDLSRLFVYFNSRLMHGDSDKDTGTYIRLAMGTLSSLGVCTEKKWPYDTSKVFVRPSWGAYREAYAHKIDAYYRIDGTGQDRIESIKRALEAHHPVVFGCLVDAAFQAIGSDGIVKMPGSTRTNVGGHAMLIVGYRDDGKTLIVRNSWGVAWGDRGYCYMPADYLDATNANDFWVPTRV